MRGTSSPVKFRSVRQSSVVDRIIEHFKQALIEGELQAGERLPSEADLCEQFGVGRSALREAMKVLQALGIVTIHQGDGTYIVDEVSPRILNPLVFAIMLETGISHELVELRLIFEIGYCELVAQNATAEDWNRIEQAARALEDYQSQANPTVEELTRLDLAFHHTVLEASHNALVIRLGQAIEELFFASMRNVYLTIPNNLQMAVGFHRAIITAMRSGDKAAIRSAVENSLVYWKEEVRKFEEKSNGTANIRKAI